MCILEDKLIISLPHQILGKECLGKFLKIIKQVANKAPANRKHASKQLAIHNQLSETPNENKKAYKHVDGPDTLPLAYPTACPVAYNALLMLPTKTLIVH